MSGADRAPGPEAGGPTRETMPLRLTRLATFWQCDAEWEVDGPQSAYVWEPLDILAPEDARPSCGSDRVVFYSASGRHRIGEAPHHHMDSFCAATLLLLGSTWYELASGKVVWRDGRWYMRWWAFKNTRAARGANAGMDAYRG